MNRLLAMLLLGISLPASAAPAAVDRYPWQAEITLPAADGAYRIVVPPLLRKAGEGTDGSELVLVDDTGEIVPSAVLRGGGVNDRVRARAQATEDPDVFTVDAFDRPVDGLFVDLPSGPSAATVRVERRTATGWEPWGSPTFVWKYPLLGQQDAVPFPASNGPFRVSLHHHAPRPLRGIDLDGWRRPAEATLPSTLRLPVVDSRLTEAGQQLYSVPLPHALPIAGVRPEIEEQLFSRPAAVRTGFDRGAWEQVSPTGTLERVRIGDAHIDRVDLPPPDKLDDDLLVLSINTAGRAPLTVPAVELELTGMELLVLNPGSTHLRLLGGAPSGTTPPADLQAALPEMARMAPDRLEVEAVGQNPDWLAPEVRAGLGEPGLELDLTGLSWQAEVQGKGLSRIALPAHVLAHSQAELNDLRLVTPEGRQVPYLLRRLPTERPSDPVTMVREEVRGRSMVKVTVPDPDIPVSTVTLFTDAPTFSRQVSFFRAAGQVLEPLRSTTWIGEDRPARLSLDIDRVVGQTLVVQIDNGDDPPLPLSGLSLSWPAWELIAVLPDSGARLVYGDPRRAPPDYDLALLERDLLPRAKAEATLSAPTALTPPPRSAFDKVMLLGGIAVLVGGMLALTVQLVRSVPAPDAAPEPEDKDPAPEDKDPAPEDKDPAPDPAA